MNKCLVIAMVVALSGCSDSSKKSQAAAEFVKQCNSNVSAELHFGEWNSYLTMRCDNFAKVTEFKP